MKNINFNINNSVLDSISKFNLFDKNFIKRLNNIVFFTKLNLVDTNFLRDFFFLSKLFFLWFNQKICVLSVVSDKKRSYNKGKNSLLFFFGCTIKKNYISKNLDYATNVLFLLIKKVEGSISLKKNNNGYVFSFSNINFLLGFKSERFFNLNLKINIFFNFFPKKKSDTAQKSMLSNKILNFYEKVFF